MFDLTYFFSREGPLAQSMAVLIRGVILACHLYDVILVEGVQGRGEVGELFLTGHYGAEHLGGRCTAL